ncbi:hypothetical protein HPT27_15285 [Permianibacter sp. IMCC34836]|uniref:hypothetical protein n=1 Tax=Permianibacter fluminis TaxID=2738515 RepID=UPI001557A1FF|nr:hypothetical protein [Permianibacter fluminis]NQD38390.1 hypothetical protein [Permianibacter fluminis]
MKKCLLLAGAALLSLGALADDVQVSGFINVGGGMLDDEDVNNDGILDNSYAGYTSEDMTFDSDSTFGLQVSKQVSDKLTATGQMVARGSLDYELDAAWVYVKYQVNDNFSWRAGRFQSPFYFYSDFLNVGYAYHWIRPPVEVYNIQQRSVTGIDGLIDFSAGNFTGSLQVYTGAEDGDQTLASGAATRRHVRNQYGLVFSGNWEWLSFRAAHHEADVTIETGPVDILPGVLSFDDFISNQAGTGLRDLGFNAAADTLEPVDDKFTFDSVALAIDTGTFVGMYETSKLDGSDTFAGTDKRSYLMLGVRAGDWMPYVTFAKADDEAANALVGIPVIPQTAQIRTVITLLTESSVDHHETKTIGVRWDFTTSAAFKLQVDDIDYDSDSGVLADESQRLISFAVQTVF